jgi:hypothetical protein
MDNSYADRSNHIPHLSHFSFIIREQTELARHLVDNLLAALAYIGI